jgi:hypothetical protein
LGATNFCAATALFLGRVSAKRSKTGEGGAVRENIFFPSFAFCSSRPKKFLIIFQHFMGKNFPHFTNYITPA